MARRSYLTTAQMLALDHACSLIRRSFDETPYLVGSVGERPDFRDVDVRLMLDDDDFDLRFADEGIWSITCYAISRWLQADTGLPIDFQIQRQTEANEKFSGPRNPLGLGHRVFAGGGDWR